MAAPNLNAFLGALLKQVQVVENTVFTILAKRFLGHAEGVQLDMIGRLVGESRLSRSDDEFRSGIRLRIFINGSSGRPEDLISVARSLTGFDEVRYRDVSPGVCWLIIPLWTPDSGELLAFLQKICPAGVKLIAITTTESFEPRVMGDPMGEPFTH